MALHNLLPTVFVIFGATGDLMHTKLAPALFHLYEQGQLPKLFQVVGFARQDLSRDAFQALVREMVRKKTPKAPQKDVDAFSRLFVYQQGLFEESEGYKNLATFLGKADESWKVCSNKLFYLAVSPQFYPALFSNLAKSGLTEPCSPKEGWTRVLVEKPFGKDLKTAQELDRTLGKLFQEEQIYRIDHYLGKETVQNILAFRFSNSFLQDSWNKESVEHIAIRLFEKQGIGKRGSLYDGLGALRDVGQNHILQLLALFTMENPGVFDGNAVRLERARVLESLRILNTKEVKTLTTRGQYQGYTKEDNVQDNSTTETYFRITAFLQNKTWKGVPLFLESGKAVGQNKVEVQVMFRHPTPCLCPPEQGKHYKSVLTYSVQPQERIAMSLWVKKPGVQTVLEEKEFSFDYKEALQGHEVLDAYERIVLAAIQGDQTMFVSTQEIMAEWKFVDSILKAWKQNIPPLTIYSQGTIP